MLNWPHLIQWNRIAVTAALNGFSMHCTCTNKFKDNLLPSAQRESEERLRKRWGTRQISSQVTNTLNINKGNTSYKGKQSDLSMQRLTHTYRHTHTYTGQKTLLTGDDKFSCKGKHNSLNPNMWCWGPISLKDCSRDLDQCLPWTAHRLAWERTMYATSTP